jgi:hypothetical protein
VREGQSREPVKFFREYVGLSDEQISAIQSGKAIAKVLDSRMPDEVFVFGAVHIDATPESYLKLAADIEALRKLPNYLAIRKFSDAPQLSDAEGFTLDEEDIKQLKNCKPGQCEVQLLTEAIEALQQSVNWTAPDVSAQVNKLAQKMALEALSRYKLSPNCSISVFASCSTASRMAATATTPLPSARAF